MGRVDGVWMRRGGGRGAEGWRGGWVVDGEGLGWMGRAMSGEERGEEGRGGGVGRVGKAVVRAVGGGGGDERVEGEEVRRYRRLRFASYTEYASHQEFATMKGWT